MESARSERKGAYEAYFGAGVCNRCGDRREYKLSGHDYFEVKGKARPVYVPKNVDAALRPLPETDMVDLVGQRMQSLQRSVGSGTKRRADNWAALVEESIHEMSAVFSGHIQPKFPKYRHREIQVRLAGHIAAALNSHRAVLLAEAGVGTGKTFAYLAPLLWLIRHKKSLAGPVIISTKTNNLLSQLLNDDVPVANVALAATQSVFKNDAYSGASAAIKGQQHYACLNRIASANRIPVHVRDTLTRWVLENHRAERDSAGFPRVTEDQWDEACATECQMERCPEARVCPYYQLRESLRYHKGIIITNHNLLAKNLLDRSEGRDAYWGSPTAIVVDEAHAFEQAVRQQLTTYISARYFKEIGALAARVEEVAPAELPGIGDLGERCTDQGQAMFRHVELADDQRCPLGEGFRQKVTFLPGFLEQASIVLTELQRVLDQIDDWESQRNYVDPQAKATIRKLNRRIDRTNRALRLLLQVVRGGNETYAAWREPNKGKGIKLAIAPIWIGDHLVDLLWELGVPVIMLSATLVAKEGFDSLKERLGLAPSNIHVKTFQASTGFDYPNKVRIFNPAVGVLPPPSSDFDEDEDIRFTDAIKPLLRQLLLTTGGRTLVLFTSYTRMTAVHEYLKDQKLPFPVLIQQPGSVHRILREFETVENSVLLATGAFWEGVDVEGPSLLQVIMDKLPFPVPSDPLVDAQKRLAGSDWFDKVFIPAMYTQLRQGAGRLIRSETDWGIISLLDPRARSQRFYATVKSALPDAPWLDNEHELQAWFQEKWQAHICDTMRRP